MAIRRSLQRRARRTAAGSQDGNRRAIRVAEKARAVSEVRRARIRAQAARAVPELRVPSAQPGREHVTSERRQTAPDEPRITSRGTGQRPTVELILGGIETDKCGTYPVFGGVTVNLRERLAAIDTSLDDLQSGMEASSRAVASLHTDTTKFDGLLTGPLLRSVLRHVQELRVGARDQQAALQELRNAVARLRRELQMPPRAAIRRQPTAGTDAGGGQ